MEHPAHENALAVQGRQSPVAVFQLPDVRRTAPTASASQGQGEPDRHRDRFLAIGPAASSICSTLQAQVVAELKGVLAEPNYARWIAQSPRQRGWLWLSSERSVFCSHRFPADWLRLHKSMCVRQAAECFSMHLQVSRIPALVRGAIR